MKKPNENKRRPLVGEHQGATDPPNCTESGRLVLL